MNLERIYEQWEKKTLAKGKRDGKVEALLSMLEGQGLTVTSAQQKQVFGCTDTARLDAWARAAGTTPSVTALLGGGAAPRGERSGAGPRHRPHCGARAMNLKRIHEQWEKKTLAKGEQHNARC